MNNATQKQSAKSSEQKGAGSRDTQILEDYLKFFTLIEGADMLQYAYEDPHGFYDNLIQNSTDYYLFNDEVQVIQQNKGILTKYLDGVTDIIEMGPGTKHAIRHKTLPILECALNLEKYHAIDISKEYLSIACEFVKENTTNLKISGVNTDLKRLSSTRLDTSNGKKCMLFLGSTLGNFDHITQNNLIREVAKSIIQDDIFILSVDTHYDEQMLMKAYSNPEMYSLLNNILEYFAYINPNFRQYIPLLKLNCSWDDQLGVVNLYFTAQDNFSFYFQNHSNVKISTGQQLKGVKSRKFKTPHLCNMLNNNNLELLNICNYSDKMQMFVCKKV